MSEPTLMDKTYNVILRRFVDTGQAPHYTDIAKELGVSMPEGKKALHDLISLGVPGWCFPGTDLIVSMAPFNNLPNQYRITINGQQKWFGQ